MKWILQNMEVDRKLFENQENKLYKIMNKKGSKCLPFAGVWVEVGQTIVDNIGLEFPNICHKNLFWIFKNCRTPTITSIIFVRQQLF